MILAAGQRPAALLILIAALALFLAGAPARAQEGSAPDAPTGLTVASVSHDSVELDWDDSGDSSITHYQVFRRDRAVHEAGEFVTIEEDTGTTATEYTDATVEADKEYVYRVKAVNAHGASPWSDQVRADTPTGPGQGAVYTYEDGDRTIRVILQGDLVVQETGADTPSDRVVRRAAGGNIVRKQSGDGGADLPVFRSASGGALMTLPGGVLLALDPEWDEAGVNRFFERNNIWKGRVSELDYIPNGFFVRTKPGFPSLELANALAAQKGVLVSSPNWWREVEARQDPGEPKGGDREAAKEARGIEPRNEGFADAYDLPLDGSFNGLINPADDFDFFKLDLSSRSSATDVRIYTTDYRSSTVGNKIVDTFGVLYSDSDSDNDGNRDQLGFNDNSFGTRHFSLLESLSPGVYYVVVLGSSDTDTGGYTLHAETVTGTSVSLGSSVAASIGGASEVDYFKLDLSGQIGNTDVSLFTLSDNLALGIEATLFESRVAGGNQDALGDERWITYLSYGRLPAESHLIAVWSADDRTGDYTLRAATVPDHDSTTATATPLSLDVPTSGRLTAASDADYFKFVLTDAKDLAIMALAYDGVDVVMLNSGDTEIPVNVEIANRVDKIIDDFASGTYYVKITAPGASSSAPVYYALYAYEDTGYGTWVDGCADDTNDLGISTINDPLYACQWHLSSDDSAGMDINVESVWDDSITGEGIHVAVVDYTIDFSHDDLSPNINSALNHDYGARSNAYRPADHHGTNVAGVIAARDNTIGVRGVAPRATIYGYNLLADGEAYFTDVNTANAMVRNRVATAVSNNSWGPVDGHGFDLAPAVWEIAVDSGVTQGYAGKGVFYAWAGGNGGRPGVGFFRGDNSNFDEYANYYGVTAVCAVGDDGARAAYSEQGANLWVCAPSSGGDRRIVTTENSDRYINDFGGTSSATPKVAGVAALLRHANPDLTWRDLKLILAASARQNDPTNIGWEEGARKYGSTDDSDRYHFNHEYGFGVVDAAAAVALAQDWSTLPEFQDASSASGTLNRTIPDYTPSGISHSVSVSSDMEFTEFVEVNVTIDHTFWRDLRIELVSPAGSVSTLAVPVVFIGTPIPPPESTVSPATFRFGSAKHLGEDPNGTWMLRVADELARDQGTLQSWSIKVYGHRDPAPDLVVDAPTVSDSNPASGTSFTLSATVRNQGGSAAAASTILRYYHSSDATITTRDTSVGTDAVSGLGAGASSVQSISLTAPASGGIYYYGACVDTVSGESATTNNCSTAVAVSVGAATAPDLIVELPSVSDSSPTVGTSFTLSFTVRNQGTGAAAATTLTYYLSSNATISTSDTSIGTDAVSALDAGASSDESISGTARTMAGTYYYGACVSTVTNESATTNNCSVAVTVTVVTPPDLVVDAPRVSASNPASGTSFTLRATVRNNGGSAAAAATLTYYRSSNATIATSDTAVGTDEVSALSTGASSDESVLLTAPTTAGTYYYRACVGTVTNESATTNNCSVAVAVTVGEPVGAAPAPDLVVGPATVDDIDPSAGTSFTLNATVYNQGTAVAGRSTVRFYRSPDAIITTNDTLFDSYVVASLGVGENSRQWIPLTAPATAGTYYYGACVDAVSDESATTNNCSTAVTWAGGAAPAPDLVVDAPTVSASSPLTGASFTFSATVRNQGNGAAGSTTLRYYRSSDATIATSDTSIGTDAVSGLDAGASSVQSISVTAPATAGTYYYGACADAVSESTSESATTNNCSTAVTVIVGAATAPDLVVDAPRVSNSIPLAGATFTLRATVHNTGGGAAAASTILRYYHSSDATITTRDTSVGTDAVSGLGAGASSVQSISLTAPASGGIYYYGACVDTVSGESATTNNCSVAVAVSVGAAARSDLAVDAPTVSDSNPAARTSFTLSATVRNQGSLRAAATTLRYYRSFDATITTSDTLVGPDRVSSLSAGASSPESIRVTASSAPGRYYYGACVDVASNELYGTNNCSAAVAVSVGAATASDLVVDPARVSDSNPAAGTSFTLSATVRNRGGRSAGSTTLRYYRSFDATITTSDTSVGTDAVGGLGAGASSDESISVTAPDTPGTYHYGACVGTVCSVAVAVTVGAATAPDLVVDPARVSAGNLPVGTSFTLRSRVRNQGGSAAGSTALRYYRSTNATITTSDSYVSWDAVDALGPGASSDESISLTAPATSGIYYYGACVNVVYDELYRKNNCSVPVAVTVGAAPAPDLVVDAPTVSDGNPAAGTSFTFSATVRNLSGGAAGSTTLRYYSRSPFAGAINTLEGTDPVGGLGAGANSAESISVDAPALAAAGYRYWACVGAVANESDTTNNCSVAVAVTVVALPDLVVDAPTVSSRSPAAGTPFTLSATVRNQGTGAAGSTTLRYYRSSNATIDTNDSSVGTDQVSGLAAAGTSAQSIDLTAPATAGTYYYGACVDAVSDESATTNNCSVAVAVTVGAPAPDLVVDAPTVSVTLAAGTSFTLNATVRNRGSRSADGTTLRYYRSFDATIATSDSLVSTDPVGGLGAGASSPQSVPLGSLNTLGIYYYGACVSTVTNESSTTNNCSAAVRVTVVAPSDLVVDTPTVSASSPLAGASFTLRATVRNQGTGAAGSTTLRYYRSSNATIDTNDSSVGTDQVSGLAAAGTSAQSIDLTAPSTSGTYYYGACVSTVTNESNTTNNCSTGVRVTVVGPPDLEVDQPTASPSSPLTGATFTLRATVRNRGGAVAGSTTLRYYRSTDDTISSSDTPEGTDSVSGLGAGASSAQSIRLTAPATTGTYYYGACVGTVAGESDTANNCSAAVTVTVTAPDLTVVSPTVSAGSPLTGSSFTFSATVRNQGNGAAGSTTLRYYRSSDATITTSDTYLGMDSVSGLGAGLSSPKSIDLTAPSTAGTYYYGACVDAVTNESATGNNCSTEVRVTVVAPPDLVVSAPRVSNSNPAAGTALTLSATVRNLGGSTAGSTILTYYRSTNATIATNDSSVGTDDVGALGAGASSPESTSVTAPSTTGTYYYGACVGTVTNESATTNNCSVAVAVTVGAAPAPDLVVEAPTVSDSSPLTGASFTLRARVRNLGSGAAGSTTLRYYRSSNDTIDTNDTSVGTDSVSSLSAGADSPESIPLTAPATTGTYYYGACVDALTNESDMTNNCSAAVRVTVGAAPVFSEGAGIERSVAENSTAGTDVGSAVRATDADNDTLTYSLEGTDADSFSIVRARGQIQTFAALDHEDKPSYSVTVRADDGKGGTATIRVTISVTDVNEPPTVEGEAQLTISENEDLIASYSASDPEGVASTFTWSVAGTDRDDFNINRNTGELTFRNTPSYESPTDSNEDNVYVFTVRATDEGGLSGSLEVTVTVENVNEPPTITGSATPPDFPENSVRSVATYQATDPEGRTIAWGLSGTDNDDFNIAGGELTFQSAPDYEKPTDSDGDNVYNVTVQATDEGGNPASLNVTVTVINSAGVEEPSITTTSRPSLTLQENGTGTIYTFRARDPQGGHIDWSLEGNDASNFTISDGALTFNGSPDFEDPADANQNSVYELTVVVTDEQGLTDRFDFTVTVTNHHENREPAITTSPSSGLTYQKLSYQENRISTVHTYRARNYGPGSISWTLRGPDFDSFDISELGALTFKSAPNHEALGDSNRDNDYEITVVASNSGGYSDRLNVVITVTDVNEGPEVSRVGSAPGSVPENQDRNQVLARYTATDPENPSAEITRWSTSGSDGGDFVINERGELRFRNVPDFERPADSNRDSIYQLQVRAYDGRHYGSFDVTVTVTDVNEPPAITTTSSSATALRQNENETSRLYTYRATDPEGADTVTWSVEGVDKEFFAIDERGQFSFKEENPPDFEEPADSGGNNVYNVEIQAADSGGIEASLPVTVTVRDVNEGPEVTSGSPSFTISENQDLPSAVYTGFDPEGGTVTRWTVGGTDGGDFTISQEGVLTFRNTPDFERPADSNRDNIYQLQVRPYDGRYYGSFDVTVTVTDVNEPPTITTTNSSATALRQNENETSRLYTYRATDPEGADTVTWSVEGVDARFFAIDERGQFSFKEENPPDFEEPADSGGNNVYNVEIQAADSGGIEASLGVTVTVRDVNEGPEVTSGSPSFTISENQDLPSAVYTGFDPEGGTVTRWTVGGTDGGDFTISQEGVLTFRNTPDFERPADSNRDNIYQLQVRPYDGRYYGSFDVTVTVTDVNEPPTITTTNSSATALRQNENETSRLYTYRATDPEGADTVTWSVEGVDARFFAIDERGQFSFKEENPPDFEEPADSGGNNVYNVEIQAADSGGIEASLGVTVTVRDVNEGPEVTSGSPSFTISENQDLPSAVYTGFDPEGGTVTRWTVGGTDGGDFTISQEGVLTFRNTPDFERPADSNRDNIYQLQVRPYDGRYYGSFDVTVTVTDVNEPPTITTTNSSATALRQNENETSRLYTYRATDPEGADTVTWSVEGVDARFFAIDERGQFSFKEENPPDFEEPADSGGNNVYNVEIQAADSGGIEASLPVTVTVANDAEGVEPTITTRRPPATYRENDTRAVYTFRASDPQRGPISWSLEGTDQGDFTIISDSSGRAVLAFSSPPDYENPEDSDRQNDYELTVIATDEDRHVDRLSFTITVTQVDEGPEVSGPLTFSINENGSLSNAVYTATDPEGSNVARWSVGGRDGGDFFITQGGTLYFRSPPDYERPADSDRNNVYEVTIQPSDGRNNGSYPVTVTVTNVNEPPEIRSGSKTSFMQQENRTSRLHTYSATDPEGGTVTWLVADTDDGRLFTIDERGQFSFREENPPDHDDPADVDGDNVYNVTIQARDPESNTASLPVAVTVTEVNEGPVISLRGSPPGSVPENTPVTRVLATYTASDPERPGVTITQWSTTGRDGGDFVINALGQLMFRTPPDHERPADSDRDNVYEVTIRASDGRNTGTLEEMQRVTVTDVDEPPTITTTSRTAFSQPENRTSTLYTFRATDPEGGTVTWTPAGPDGSHFAIDEGGALSFANPPDYERSADSGRDNMYEVTIRASDGRNMGTLDVTVTVTDHNEGVEPTISTRRPPATYRENDTRAVYTFRATDPQRDTIIWTLKGTDAADFTIGQDTGVLTFATSPDFESPADEDRDNTYELTVVAADPERNSDRVDFAVTVTDHNEGEEPTISTRRPPATYRENDTRTVYTFRATDPQRDTIIWTLVGTDAGHFTITPDNSGRGVLAFSSPPDFESPADADKNNTYELTVVAADPERNSDRVDFTITVTDVNEGPVISVEGSETSSVPENTPDTRVLADYRATDPEDPTANIFRWSTTGRDGGDFVISDLGELRFRSSPDYERPADSDRDNLYEVTVRAYDGRIYGAHDVTVTVAQVNEAPVITTKSRTEFTLRENFTAVLYTYRATDQDEDDAVTWSVEGDDGGDFAIYNGILNFRLLPDLENPVDADTDNVYEITVVAEDRAGLRDTVDAVITITDQSEGPVIAGARAHTVAENYDIAQVLGSYTATDAKDNRPVFPRWSLSGRDGGDFTINEDGELTFRNIPDYDRPADANRDNVYEVTVRGHDSQAYGNLEVTVTVTPVNEHAPVVTGRETLSFRENTAVETRLHTYRATDGDRDTSFTWSLEGDDSDAFVIDQGGVLTFSAPPDYEDPADSGTDNVYQVTVVASDGAKRGTLGVTVTVTEQNEGPVVSGAPEFTINENQHLPSSAVYTARDPEAVGGVTTAIRWSVSGRDGGDFTIDRDTGVLAFRTPPDHERPADANRDNVYEVTVRAHDGRNYGDFQVTVTVEDVAEITGPAAISRTENFEGVLATYSPAGQGALDVKPSWRLTGADSGDFTIDRESGELTFRSIPDHERPADSNRDNVYSFAVSVSDGSYHGTLDVTVTVTAVNEPPAITGRDSLSFRENTPVTTRLHTYRATDPEGDGFTWRLGGLDASDFNITTDSSGMGVLTFSSPPNFDSPGGSGAHGNQYLVTVQAEDDQGQTGAFPVTVTVTDQNEGAVVTGDQTIAVEENRDPTLTLHTYSATDPEGQRITRWSLSGSDRGDFLISENGELTFRNTPDYDRPADSNRDNEYLVTVRAYDGRTYGNLDVTITVSNVNEHDPVIRSGSRTSFTYREEGTAALYTYRATDGDKDDVIRWTTEGTDGGDFTIDGDTGELTFREPPDYEHPEDSGRDNLYNLAVVATDSGRQSASLDVTVTVTAVDEGPEITGATTHTVSEGQDLTGAIFTAQDPEDADAAVTSWRLAGSDTGDFTITDTGGNSARLTFRNTPDYDRPADSNRDNEYLVTIRAYNGSTYGSLDVTVTVTDRNEAEPVVTGRDTLSFRENTATTTRLHTYRATDTDRDTEITWSVEGDDGNNFAIEEGVLTFSAPPDYEGPTDSDGDNVYQVRVVASDGSKEGTLAVTVTVTDVSEGPEITGTQSLSFAENTATDRVLATYAATDPEDPDLEITRWSVTGRDGGDFTINEDGELTFRNPPDHERPADSGGDNLYEVTVRASDGRVYGAHDVTVTVTPVDEAPDFRKGSKDSFSYRENGTAALYTYRATDPEGDEVTWSVRGADASHFEIGRETGVLTFREPPDHDEPADDGRDNEYQVTVVATDQTGRAASLPVTVTVTDVNEGPEIAETGTNTAITVDENYDQVLFTYTATDPEDANATIRWSVTGRDGGDFTISERGELTFRNPPDHERPADSGRDNVYEVTVRASDGRYYGTLDVVVTVEAVDEAPEFQRNTQDSFVYPENGASAIYTYRATDPEGSDVTWGLSGTDSGAFSIGKTGVLTFKSPPDYEAPADRDDDNVYQVVVHATDDDSNTTPLDVTVTVTNLTDARAVIRGTAQVGRTLTAETSGIPDEDRRDKVDLSYQWLADDKDIEGATDPTYEITEKDEGKAIKVRVTFTDNAGREETLTSAATAPVKPAQSNEPAAGLPTINGTAQVGETLTADTSGISDADGMTNAVFRYQWTRWDSDTDEDIEGATDSTYEVSDEDEGKTIRLRVGFSDDRGNDEALTSAAIGAVAARPAQLTATFPASPFQSSRHKGDDDRPQVIVAFNLPVQSFDETTPSVSVTGATVSSLVRHEEDGLENAWVFFLDPEGNDDVVFTLVAGQSCDVGGICTGEGKMLSEGGTITLPGPDEEDKPDNTDSNEPNSPATGLPTINGTAQVGETLTADTSGIIDADGLSNVQYEYQWLADDAEIAGATNATYILAAADEGKAIKVEVSFTDDADNEETLTSAATGAVDARPNSPATGAPTIAGTAQVGQTLTADTLGIADADGLANATFSYQWLADDTDIAGATGLTYTLTDSEESKAITVQVSFTDDADNEETLTSGATDTVEAAQPTEPPTKPSGLSATASHDSVTLTWDDPGDDSITGYVILRRILGVDPEGQFDELVADTGTAATTYTDDTVSAETRYTYRIKAINEHGVSERSRWLHIDTLVAPSPEEEQAAEPPAKATGLSSEVSHNMVTLTWDDPNDDSITGYLILRRDKDIHEEGTFLTVAPDTGSSETTYVDASVEPERRYVYRIKAINASGVSEISSWVRAYTPAVPDPAPEAPAKPTSLSATFSHDSVTLTWDAPGDDSITGYVILRRDKDLQPEEGTFFTVMSDTGSAETTFTDDMAEPDKRYVYRIKAINEHGEMSELSSWVRAYTPAAP